MSPMQRGKTTGQHAGDLFGLALDALLADAVSPDILHQLIDLAVALRDHERAKQANQSEQVEAE